MIEIKMTGMCEGCPNADLELDCMMADEIAGTMKKVWSVKCIHEHVCKAAAEKYMEKKE